MIRLQITYEHSVFFSVKAVPCGNVAFKSCYLKKKKILIQMVQNVFKCGHCLAQKRRIQSHSETSGVKVSAFLSPEGLGVWPLAGESSSAGQCHEKRHNPGNHFLTCPVAYTFKLLTFVHFKVSLLVNVCVCK